MELTIGDTTLNTLHNVDIQVVIAQDKEHLKFITRKLTEGYKNRVQR